MGPGEVLEPSPLKEEKEENPLEEGILLPKESLEGGVEGSLLQRLVEKGWKETGNPLQILLVDFRKTGEKEILLRSNNEGVVEGEEDGADNQQEKIPGKEKEPQEEQVVPQVEGVSHIGVETVANDEIRLQRASPTTGFSLGESRHEKTESLTQERDQGPYPEPARGREGPGLLGKEQKGDQERNRHKATVTEKKTANQDSIHGFPIVP